MKNSSMCEISFWGLVERFTEDTRTFVKEEGKLLKTEMTEKACHFSRSAVPAALGGFIAYTGLTLVFFAIGLLLAYAFEQMGIQPLLAAAAGLGAAGVLVAAVGAILLVKGVRSFSKETLKPEKTIETVQNLKGDKKEPKPDGKEKNEGPDTRNSRDIERSVLAIEDQMTETLAELGRRVSLTNAREHAKTEIRSHPYRWGLVAMGTGFAGSLLLKRKVRLLESQGFGSKAR